MGQLENIHRHQRKERLRISKITKFESGILSERRYRSAKLRKFTDVCFYFILLDSPIIGRVTATAWRQLLRPRTVCGFFNVSQNLYMQGLWDGAYDLSSLSEKTRKSNRLQMSLQRQHFLLSYLKTLSVGPAGTWTSGLPLGRPALIQLS